MMQAGTARKVGVQMDTWQDLGAAIAIGAGKWIHRLQGSPRAPPHPPHPRFSPLAPKSSRQGNAICESRKVLEGAQERGGGQRQGEDCQRGLRARHRVETAPQGPWGGVFPSRGRESCPGSRAVGRRGSACVERRGQKPWSSENQGIWTGLARKVS